MAELGKQMHDARVARELELAEVADLLGIPTRDLRALEWDRLDLVRDDDYAKRILGHYMRFLELEPAGERPEGLGPPAAEAEAPPEERPEAVALVPEPVAAEPEPVAQPEPEPVAAGREVAAAEPAEAPREAEGRQPRAHAPAHEPPRPGRRLSIERIVLAAGLLSIVGLGTLDVLAWQGVIFQDKRVKTRFLPASTQTFTPPARTLPATTSPAGKTIAPKTTGSETTAPKTGTKTSARTAAAPTTAAPTVTASTVTASTVTASTVTASTVTASTVTTPRTSAPTTTAPTTPAVVPTNPSIGTPTSSAGAPGEVDVSITATRGDCFLTVRLNSQTGRLIFGGVLRRGRTLAVHGKRIWMRLGAAGNVQATLNGRQLGHFPTGTLDLVFDRNGFHRP